ncbi:MAG: VPLPA-CTERM sorting domain-containing protein [Phycisphaerales bacterium]
MTTTRILAALSAAAGIAQAGDLYYQDFESTSGYTTSVPEFTDDNGDYFHRTNGGGMSSSVNYDGASGYYFAGMDIDSPPGGSIDLPVSLISDTFSIAGATDIMFSVDLAEDDDGSSQDWDGPDFVSFEYSIDGGAWTNIFTVESDIADGAFNGEPEVNGVAVTDMFNTFSADLSALSGSTLAIRVLWDLDSGDEDLAIDNIRVTGNVVVVPLPAAAWGGLGMLGLMAGVRMRRK